MRTTTGLLLALLAAGTAAGAQPPADPAAATQDGPLARIAAAARASMTAAGLERMEVEAAGRRLVLWRGGSGPDLVLLHGSGQQAGSWAAVVPGLAEGHTLHVLDLPGHGDSEPAEGPLAMADVVAGAEAYVVSIGRPAVLVGNSMGAWIATLVAHRHPDAVTRLVLVNGGALLNVPAAGLTLTPADREEARRVMAALRDPQSPPLPDELLDDIVVHSRTGPTGRLLQDLPSLMSQLLDGHLGEVTVPVDLLWGASDQLMTLDYARRMEAQLPRARLTVLEHCGHIPESECPEHFLAALQEVLAMPPPSPPEPPLQSSLEPRAGASPSPLEGGKGIEGMRG